MVDQCDIAAGTIRITVAPISAYYGSRIRGHSWGTLARPMH
jgi:hypothetical protein